MTQPRLFVAIPAMNELSYLPRTLHDLVTQTFSPFEIYVCVNQPESYRHSTEKKPIYDNNQQLLSFLKTYKEFPLHILDYSSPGKGWTDKKLGVGWARKVLFDAIMQIAEDDDILVSLDADTHIRPAYLQSLVDTFTARPTLQVLSVPYYHLLTGEETCDRAILRYELYMRNYSLSLYRIGCPYHFTAIGSAMAFRVKALRKIGGITPVKSGEDFYLMQKLCKTTTIGTYNAEPVYPAARYSDRVFFGTGPALIKGSQGQWDAYPIYHHSLFEDIALTYQRLPQLYEQDVHTDFLDFLQVQSGLLTSMWQPLRENMKDLAHFIQAFHEKADGLRILQYLRQKRQQNPLPDDRSLQDNIQFLFAPSELAGLDDTPALADWPIDKLDCLRKLFYEKEMQERQNENVRYSHRQVE